MAYTNLHETNFTSITLRHRKRCLTFVIGVPRSSKQTSGTIEMQLLIPYQGLIYPFFLLFVRFCI